MGVGSWELGGLGDWEIKNRSLPLTHYLLPVTSYLLPFTHYLLPCHQRNIAIALEGRKTATKTVLVVGSGLRLCPR